jgi:hypothetical protein
MPIWANENLIRRIFDREKFLISVISAGKSSFLAGKRSMRAQAKSLIKRLKMRI